MSATETVEDKDVGEPIPPLTAHAVSVSLPTWRACVGYEEGQDWVMSKMKTGYPRFFIHKSIQKFARAVADRCASPNDGAVLFPSHRVAVICLDFFRSQAPSLTAQKLRIVDLVPDPQKARPDDTKHVSPKISAVIHPQEHAGIAKTFWQHSGDGVSSRRAEFCHRLFDEGYLVEKPSAEGPQRMPKGPKRYQKRASVDHNDAPTSSAVSHQSATGMPTGQDSMQFVEERFGRNLEASMAERAKLAIRRRIAGSLTANVDLAEALETSRAEDPARRVEGFAEDDVYLYPAGMSAIFNTHRSMLAARGPLKSVNFGFPYIDTLKILEKFGPGCLFYGHASSDELDDLEKRLRIGEKYLALFCEFPGNPLLKSPDLQRVRQLADKYDFGVVVDETVGNFLNVNVLPFADVVVSSLTKVFSGDSNVMGGSAVLNPKSRYYHTLKQIWGAEYEDNCWPEDAVFLERNSRDFVARTERINHNAEAVCELLRAHPRVKGVYYPKCSDTRRNFDRCRNPQGGYGGLLSATFYSTQDAVDFYDNLDTAKGPSLGTNFTLSSPYVILAHYNELDWVASCGVEPDLVRFSIGLEDTQELLGIFRHALEAIDRRAHQ